MLIPLIRPGRVSGINNFPPNCFRPPHSSWKYASTPFLKFMGFLKFFKKSPHDLPTLPCTPRTTTTTN